MLFFKSKSARSFNVKKYSFPEKIIQIQVLETVIKKLKHFYE